jgi:hypothetical protein
MELALSEDYELIEASHGVKGFCPLCKAQLIPRCGQIRDHHWAHKSGKECDPWWEGETHWHRQWKQQVDKKFREKVIEKAGEKHRADVLLSSGITFEFQKSPLSLIDRQSRENFYNNLIWVIHFQKDKILETEIREMYQPTFGDSLIRVKGFSEGFFHPPHLWPIFLDFDDDQMFWIKEFDTYDYKREKKFFGRFIQKSEFINHYLLNPNFSNIDELKVTHLHHDYELKQNELFAAREKLADLKDQLRIAKNQFILEKRRNWYAESSPEWIELDRQLRPHYYFEEECRRRAFKPHQCPNCKLWYYSIDAFEKHKKTCL